MGTHQILHHAHPLAAQFCHQTINIHKIMITDVLNEVVQSNKHACPAHTSTEEQIENILMSVALPHVQPINRGACGYLQWTAMVVFSCLCTRTAFTNLMKVLQDSGTPCSGQDV